MWRDTSATIKAAQKHQSFLPIFLPLTAKVSAVYNPSIHPRGYFEPTVIIRIKITSNIKLSSDHETCMRIIYKQLSRSFGFKCVDFCCCKSMHYYKMCHTTYTSHQGEGKKVLLRVTASKHLLHAVTFQPPQLPPTIPSQNKQNPLREQTCHS